MSLQATCREVGDVTLIDFSGKITLGEASAMVRRTVRDLVDRGRRKIVLNLDDVDYIDSAGLGELVSAHTVVRSANGELKLMNLSRRVNDVLQITRLFTVFDVQANEDAALRSFD